MRTTEAIVLFKVDYRDSSKILHLYAKDGHHSVVAHGVKKLNSMHRVLAQIGNVIRLDLSSSRDLPSLKDGELVHEFPTVQTDPIGLAYLSHMLDLVRLAISSDSDHEKMYQFLIKLLQRLERGWDPELLTFVFELKLLHFLGHGLSLAGCTMCNEAEDLVFHISSGGLLCRQHLTPVDVSYDQDIYGLIDLLYRLDVTTDELPVVAPNDRVILRHIIDLLYEEFVGVHTRSRSILRQLKKY